MIENVIKSIPLDIANLNNEWVRVYGMTGFSACYAHKKSSLKAIYSCDVMQDGKKYLHLSVSRKNKLPTWEDLKHAKNVFMGDIEAFHLLPKKEHYVNAHEYCMHLWSEIPNERIFQKLEYSQEEDEE